MYGSANRLSVKNGDAAFGRDELGSCSLESGDERLLTPLSLTKLVLEELDVVLEALGVGVAHALVLFAFKLLFRVLSADICSED